LLLGVTFAYAELFDFTTSDFNILDADSTHVIGRAHYEVSPDGNEYSSAFGEDRLKDGKYDIDRDKLEIHHDGFRAWPCSSNVFRRQPHAARVSKANLETGAASCIQCESGRPVVH
jgi:hypothetical protein